MKVAKIFVRFFAINILFILLAITFHELGHSVFSLALGCKAKAVIFDTANPFPYSEIYCTNFSPLIYLGGLIFVLPLPFLVSWLMNEDFRLSGIGLSFLMASHDLSLLLGVFIEPFIFVSFIVSFLGEVKTINFSVNQVFKNIDLK
ncbi:MAG: hypothetical protein J7L39_03940 [Candidatus Aenigmarchaeota archaeon]|nr:hypothetical protein [Candidatus Aenigmarchaeota archaeon]